MDECFGSGTPEKVPPRGDGLRVTNGNNSRCPTITGALVPLAAEPH